MGLLTLQVTNAVSLAEMDQTGAIDCVLTAQGLGCAPIWTSKHALTYYATRSSAIASAISTNINSIRLGGYFAEGDGGRGAMYNSVANTGALTASQFQSDGGARRWQLSNVTIFPEYLGACANGSVDDSAAIIAANAIAVINKGIVKLQAANYGIASQISFDVPVVGSGATVCSFVATATMTSAMVLFRGNANYSNGFRISGACLADYGAQPSGANGSQFNIHCEYCRINGFHGGQLGNNNDLKFNECRFRFNGTIWNCGTSYTQAAIRTTSASTISGSGSTLTIAGGLDPTTLGLRLDLDLIKIPFFQSLYAANPTYQDSYIITGVTSTTISVYPSLPVAVPSSSPFAILKGSGCEITKHTDNNLWHFSNPNFTANSGCGLRDNALYGAGTILQINDSNLGFDRIIGIRTGPNLGPTYGAKSDAEYNEFSVGLPYWHLYAIGGQVISPIVQGAFAKHKFDAASSPITIDTDWLPQYSEIVNATTASLTKTVSVARQSSAASDFVYVLPDKPTNPFRPEFRTIPLGDIGGKQCTVKTISATTSINGVSGTTGIAFRGSYRTLTAYWSSNLGSAGGWIISGEPAILIGSATFDPPSIAAGGFAPVTTVAVTGAALGDMAQVSFSLDLQGLILNAYVSAANTVSVRFQNPTAGAIDLASGTITALVTDIT